MADALRVTSPASAPRHRAFPGGRDTVTDTTAVASTAFVPTRGARRRAGAAGGSALKSAGAAPMQVS